MPPGGSNLPALLVGAGESCRPLASLVRPPPVQFRSVRFWRSVHEENFVMGKFLHTQKAAGGTDSILFAGKLAATTGRKVGKNEDAAKRNALGICQSIQESEPVAGH